MLINYFFKFVFSDTKELEFSGQDNTIIKKQNGLFDHSANVEEQGNIIYGKYCLALKGVLICICMLYVYLYIFFNILLITALLNYNS